MWKFDETRLRVLRESRGLTQTECAHKLGKNHKQQVAAWEAGEYVPSTKMLVRIANTFGVVPAFFYVEDETAPSAPVAKSCREPSQRRTVQTQTGWPPGESPGK